MLMLFSEQARWRPGARGEHVGDPWCRVMLNNSAKRSAEPQETATNCGDALFTGCHVNCETVRKQVRCRVANGNHLNQGFLTGGEISSMQWEFFFCFGAVENYFKCTLSI